MLRLGDKSYVLNAKLGHAGILQLAQHVDAMMLSFLARQLSPFVLLRRPLVFSVYTNLISTMTLARFESSSTRWVEVTTPQLKRKSQPSTMEDVLFSATKSRQTDMLEDLDAKWQLVSSKSLGKKASLPPPGPYAGTSVLVSLAMISRALHCTHNRAHNISQGWEPCAGFSRSFEAVEAKQCHEGI